ncbi:hypothetical protein DF17_08105 [Streptomyces rimosus]|nr:hypothetical protein DF17_08105 [Streptomyces rimosus]
MIQFANPENSGVANISSMIVPCIVNAWLNCSFDRIWWPGRASSARITSASRPPTQKNANEVIRYSVPIVLWSVVVSHCTGDLFTGDVDFMPRRCPGPERTSPQEGVKISGVPDTNRS